MTRSFPAAYCLLHSLSIPHLEPSCLIFRSLLLGHAQKITHLIPTPVGTALVAVLPETLRSPMLTAEWERRLKEVERGEFAPDSFTDGIAALVRDLTETYQTVPGAETLFPSEKKSVGKCPRCGADVNESKRGYFCENRACRFALWKESRFFTAKKKSLTKSVAAALLKDGRVKLTNCSN